MRRKNPRVAVDVLVNKLVDGVPYLASTRDLSLGGLYLNEISEPVHRPDARISVEMMLPGQNDIIWLETDVVRDEAGRGTGLKFKELSPRAVTALSRFSCRPRCWHRILHACVSISS